MRYDKIFLIYDTMEYALENILKFGELIAMVNNLCKFHDIRMITYAIMPDNVFEEIDSSIKKTINVDYIILIEQSNKNVSLELYCKQLLKLYFQYNTEYIFINSSI